MISPTQRAVLAVLAEGWGEMYFSFAAIMAQTDLSRTEVRDACRELRHEGLAEFSNALWDFGTDRPAGSGYRILPAGQAAIEDAAALARGRGYRYDRLYGWQCKNCQRGRRYE